MIMTLKEAMLAAKEIIEILEKKGRVNSQHFGIVYFTLTGNKYIYSNCTTCFADSYRKLKVAYKDILDNKKCSECQPPKNLIDGGIIEAGFSESLNVSDIKIEGGEFEVKPVIEPTPEPVVEATPEPTPVVKAKRNRKK